MVPPTGHVRLRTLGETGFRPPDKIFCSGVGPRGSALLRPVPSSVDATMDPLHRLSCGSVAFLQDDVAKKQKYLKCGISACSSGRGWERMAFRSDRPDFFLRVFCFTRVYQNEPVGFKACCQDWTKPDRGCVRTTDGCTPRGL